MVMLFGAAPDTGNQGVTALCHSAVDGLGERGVGPITVVDHGRGLRREFWQFGGTYNAVRRIGVTHHRRIWRGDCLRTVRAMSSLGGLGNIAADAIARTDAVLDVSGGDSFTDIYGQRRFQAMCMTKRLALDAGRPLILLPQTLGPFRTASARKEATEILMSATAVWVRDAASYQMLQDMLGNAFDPTRHHFGVDMALLLRRKPAALPQGIADWLAQRHERPVAGLNVSGLLYQGGTAAQTQFGLRSDARESIEAAARAILNAPDDFRLVLVPHVMRDPSHPESDWAAARALEKRLLEEFPDRVATLRQGLGAAEMKDVIARFDWFSGARMHATIAAFSSGVPTLGLGYSDKAAGVFAACGIDGQVADLRQLDATAIAAAVRASIDDRSRQADALSRTLPGVLNRAEDQMDQIAQTIHALAVAQAA